MNMHTGDREPYCRTGVDMDLPKGKPWRDRPHCRRCAAMSGHVPADECCDSVPSVSREAERSEA